MVLLWHLLWPFGSRSDLSKTLRHLLDIMFWDPARRVVCWKERAAPVHATPRRTAVPRTTTPSVLTTIAAVLAFAGTVLAQPAITVDVENPVLLPGERTSITLLAGYGGSDYAIAGVNTDLVTSVGSEGWSVARGLPPMSGPGTSPGTASPTGYDMILAGQLNFPEPTLYADPTNPIGFWRATYTAPMDPAAPFDVDLSTMTRRYDVYIDRDSSRSESRLDELAEGSATIRVIPAPASALALVGGLLVRARRR